MKKISILVLCIAAVILIIFNFKPDKNPSDAKELTANETTKLLKEINLDEEFVGAKELFNNMGLPSDGYKYYKITMKDNIAEDFKKVYAKESISYEEAIENLKTYCSDEKLTSDVEKDFKANKDGNFALIKAEPIENSETKEPVYTNIYIISQKGDTVDVFYFAM